MENFMIITDATCDLDLSYIKEKDIRIISMTYRICDEDHTFGNGEDNITIGEFYNLMRKNNMPKSAQVTTSAAEEVFEPYLKEGKDILYIAFSSALSGSCASVIAAAEHLKAKYPGRKLIVIDSLCASLGEGLYVDYAVECRKKGMSINETAKYLESIKQNLCQYFTVDDLNHLHRGGRVSKVAAIVGSLLGIKPVLHVSEVGKLIPIEKVRGRKKALDGLVNKMSQKIGGRIPQRVFISHGDCLADAEYVRDLITEKLGITDISIGSIGPVVGTHSGPGTVALFFLGDSRTEKK